MKLQNTTAGKVGIVTFIPETEEEKRIMGTLRNHYFLGDITESYIQIGYSCGLYGCNGMLLKGASGQLYAVTSRTTAIYIF